MKKILLAAVGLLSFSSLCRADSNTTITVDLGSATLSSGQLAIPFSALNGTLVSGQSETVTVLFDGGQSIAYAPPYASLSAALLIGTNLSPYPEFAAGTGTFLAANGSDLFTPIALGSADGTDGPNGPGEMALLLAFPPPFTGANIYGFQFNIDFPDPPGVSVNSGEFLLNVEPVSEPSAFLLVLAGLSALVGLRRTKLWSAE